jgi:hypothetical protein
MSDFLAPRRWLCVLAIALPCLTATVGCQHGPKKYHISGKVLYKNGTVPKGGIAIVSFTPTKDSTAEVRQTATGAIGPDGSFEMYTRQAGDGVYAGDYVVVFQVAKAVMDPQPLILEKYWSASKSPFKITVDRDVNDLNYEIEPLPGVSGKAAATGGGPGPG